MSASSAAAIFDLPDRISAKADPELVTRDVEHFASMAAAIERRVADLGTRLAVQRRLPGGAGQRALDRDQEIHRLSARLRVMERFGADLCLGRMVTTTGVTRYVGRVGLTDPGGERLLVDWRSPDAEPFFAATHADPMGLTSRRRYRWNHGRITDYWDEVFSPGALDGHAALDDQSAFIASLGASRSSRMRDVLGTIQADQDAIIRAGTEGALVVDGGPGTGKTVVALHRAAYLLYAEPRLGRSRGGVLVVGPSEPYLGYVADVLPALGEEGVRLCTLRDLVPEGATAEPEPDPELARLKSTTEMVAAIEPAVGLYEEPPTVGLDVRTPWAEAHLSASDWAWAFAAPAPGTPHNEARREVWQALVELVVDQHEEDVSAALVEQALRHDRELVSALNRAWPLIDATELVGDLWSVPAYLRRCAPHLERDQVQALQREDPQAWTLSDLPLLDAARHRLGELRSEPLRRPDDGEREAREQVMDNLLHADDDGEGLVTMLLGEDLQGALEDVGHSPAGSGRLAGTFGHIVVDEAQELTDAQWQMLLRRCPSRSLTVVGDRAQARRGFAETWRERLERIGLANVELASLSISYRTPREVMAEAEPMIRTVLPDANVPVSVRQSGIAVGYGAREELAAVVERWLAEHSEGTACVIGAPGYPSSERVRSLSPQLAKGLEFDLVVIVDPQDFGTGVQGAVDRYVATTRATRQLVVLGAGVSDGQR